MKTATLSNGLKLTEEQLDLAARIQFNLRVNGQSVRSLARSLGLEYERTKRVLFGERYPRDGELEQLAEAAGIRLERGGTR